MIRRNAYMDKLHRLKDKNIIKVITGVRRCGKSTLLQMFQDEVKNELPNAKCIDINLESGIFRKICTSEDLYDYVKKRLHVEEQNYVFLDEIQNIPDFQKVVDWLFVEKNVDLYITGSNAYLLSGELATLLSGRYIEIKMLPLSFAEYMEAQSIQETNTQKLYNEYLLRSSFPGALEYHDRGDLRNYLEGIYNTILIKDVATRKQISDISMLQSVVEYMYDNIGNLSSAAKIAGAMTSSGRKISTNTVEAYIQALVDSFILYRVTRYDIKGKDRLRNGAKYYAVDIGLRYYLLGTNMGDIGHILENVVYLELLRRENEVFVGKTSTLEVDFVAINNGKKKYYQVSQTILDEHTLNRELASLKSIKDNYPKYILTMDYLPDASFDGIQHINVFDWLAMKE